MNFLVGFIIPFLSFLLQSYPRFFNKYFGVDVWTRLTETDLIRKNNHKIPGKITKGFIIDGYFDYPPLFPLLLSFIPKQTLENIQGFVAPFFDLIHCYVIFLIALQLTNSIEISLLSQLIYMSTPLIALENSYLTPRSFGYLNFTLATYPLLIYSLDHKLIYLLIGYIFTTLIFLSHRFATQSFLFVVIFFTVIDKTLFYFLVFSAGLLTALLLTKRYYLRVLKGHWSNIYFWILNYKYRFSHQVRGNIKNKQNKDFVALIYSLLSKLSPIALLGINIWIVSAFVFFYARIKNIEFVPFNNPMFYKMSLWILFFYLFAIAVLSIKRLIPIGEGQRYLEMATAPSSILSAILFYSLFNSELKVISIYLFILLVIANLSLIVFIQNKGVIKDKDRTLNQDMKKMYDFINKMKLTPRIICIPHQITTMTLYNTKADILVNADNEKLMTMFDFYPIIKKPIEKIAKKYKLDHLLLRENFAKLKELEIKNPKIVFKAGDIVLVKL